MTLLATEGPVCAEEDELLAFEAAEPVGLVWVVVDADTSEEEVDPGDEEVTGLALLPLALPLPPPLGLLPSVASAAIAVEAGNPLASDQTIVAETGAVSEPAISDALRSGRGIVAGVIELTVVGQGCEVQWRSSTVQRF